MNQPQPDYPDLFLEELEAMAWQADYFRRRLEANCNCGNEEFEVDIDVVEDEEDPVPTSYVEDPFDPESLCEPDCSCSCHWVTVH